MSLMSNPKKDKIIVMTCRRCEIVKIICPATSAKSYATLEQFVK